jgi:hypothetical protein
VLTDRFSDAIRTFTVRAAQARFSLRDIDLVLRRFDQDSSLVFGRRARRVAAGLEQLLYISPIELIEWVRALRERNGTKISSLVRSDLQSLIERLGIGRELLGAEPLELLIHEFVLTPDDGPEGSTFAAFQNGVHPIDLLATTTNLTKGELETLPVKDKSASHVSLEHGLLASSAFPFVFRPKRSWELFSDASAPDQYVDGGVMDNLPFDAIAKYLLEHSREGPARRFCARPQSPHLILATSLEPDVKELSLAETQELAADWPSLSSRIRKLRYNRKVRTFAGAQRDIRAIYQQYRKLLDGAEPLDIEVIAIRPRWLCGTFAFHPMLGFRQRKQAASIAHGCATTLATLALVAETEAGAKWCHDWGITTPDIDWNTVHHDKDAARDYGGTPPFELDPAVSRSGGVCWFRKESLCPFSRQGLRAKELAGRVPDAVIDALPRIYEQCGQWSSHQPRSD